MDAPHSFGEALANWLVMRCLNRRPRTAAFYRECAEIIRRNWPQIDIPVQSITLSVVMSFAQQVAHHCPSRWNTIVSAIRFVTPHGKQLTRRRLNVREFNPPTREQFQRLLACADGLRRSHAGIVIRFLSSTGLRHGEAMGLLWENVFEDRIEIPARITKTGKARHVPLTDAAKEAIAMLKALGQDDYVMPRQHCRKGIEKACKLAGLSPLSIHCFRHLFTTRCVEAGVDLPTIARWLGHQDSGALLARTYYHLLNEHSHAAARKVKI